CLLAACAACHGFPATTPTKFFLTTTFTTPGRSLIEPSSTFIRFAPIAGGRTTWPYNIPGRRTLWTYSNSPVAIAGISIRGTGVPRTVHSAAFFRLARVFNVRLNFLPPTRSAYVTFLEVSDLTATTPSFTDS